MIQPSNAHPPASSPADTAPRPSAVLVLDASGKVSSASAEAKALWQAAEGELLGEFFPTLFAIDVVADDPEIQQAQWEILTTTTLEKSAVLSIQPREGAPRAMVVRMERAIGSSGGFFVLVQPVSAPEAPRAPAPDDSAAALQLFAEKGSVGFFDLNLRERRVLYSPAWKRMLGYADSELADTYEAWLGLLHPEDTAAAPDKAGRKFKVGARSFAVDFRMKHKRGHWIWIQCVGLQLVGGTGDLERVIGIHIDATERKELEEAVLTSDLRMNSLAEEGALAAFELDFQHDAVWFSQAWVRLFGGETTPADGPAALAAALPEDEFPEGIEAWLLSKAAGRTDFTQVMRMRAADGRPVPALLGLNCTVSRKRALERVVGFVCPLPENLVTDAKAPETEAEDAEDGFDREFFEDILGALAEGVIATDAQGRVFVANTAAQRLLGGLAQGAVGRPLEQIFTLIDRQTGKPGDNPLDRALSASGPLPLVSDHALATEGAEPLPIVWTARAFYGSDNRPVGAVIVFRNPDEMSLTPEELVKANRFEALGLLAGGIAHDFNNLLTTILGGISIAKDNHDTSALADSEKACMTAKSLTKQLLAFTKGGSGVMSVCDPKEILEDAVKIASAGANTEITVEVKEGTSPVKVDRAQILQVFQNLIVNAVQAMPPAPHRGRVQLRAAVTRVAEGQIATLVPADYVEFEVRDNGSGIAPENLEKIWDPFFTTKKHGTGLGLATVLSIVRKIGGEIGVQSTVGVGTVFSVFLPIADQPVDVQARPAPSLRFGTGRVLFMDDDEHICSLTATMLQSLDYKFDIAKIGEDAVTLYKRYLNIGRPYDAVIMDLTVIGGMGGEETFRILRDLDPDVRAIVSSGYDNEDMARQYLDMGFCGYLTKPYRVADLGKVLKAVLG